MPPPKRSLIIAAVLLAAAVAALAVTNYHEIAINSAFACMACPQE
jgi:hypothetical protein